MPAPNGQERGSWLGRFARPLWVVLGTIFLILGAVGVVVPVLPTTPFLLLTAACYARGSRRFHHWVLHNRVFGQYLSDYYEGRGVPLRTKAVSLVLLWATIAFSIYRVDHLHVRLGLFALAAAVSAHVITRPSRSGA